MLTDHFNFVSDTQLVMGGSSSKQERYRERGHSSRSHESRSQQPVPVPERVKKHKTSKHVNAPLLLPSTREPVFKMPPEKIDPESKLEEPERGLCVTKVDDTESVSKMSIFARPSKKSSSTPTKPSNRETNLSNNGYHKNKYRGNAAMDRITEARDKGNLAKSRVARDFGNEDEGEAESDRDSEINNVFKDEGDGEEGRRFWKNGEDDRDANNRHMRRNKTEHANGKTPHALVPEIRINRLQNDEIDYANHRIPSKEERRRKNRQSGSSNRNSNHSSDTPTSEREQVAMVKSEKNERRHRQDGYYRPNTNSEQIKPKRNSKKRRDNYESSRDLAQPWYGDSRGQGHKGHDLSPRRERRQNLPRQKTTAAPVAYAYNGASSQNQHPNYHGNRHKYNERDFGSAGFLLERRHTADAQAPRRNGHVMRVSGSVGRPRIVSDGQRPPNMRRQKREGGVEYEWVAVK